MALDIDKLTLGEIAKIEDLSGQSFMSLGEDGTPKGLLLAALAYTAKRRQNIADGLPPVHAAMWNECLDMTFDEANTLVGLNDEPAAETEDPTPAPVEEPVPARAPRKTRATSA